MTKWQQHRQMLLLLTFASVCFTLIRFSLDPIASNRPAKHLTFPSIVPLPGWQTIESRPLANPIGNYPKTWEAVLASHKYRYKHNNQQMEIEMRYLVNTVGDLHSYFQHYTSIQVKDTQLLHNLRQQERVGSYSLFIYQGRSHLSACINPHGGATVTSTQFLANRNTYDFQLQRLVPWLLGKETLPDRRCLWVDISIPANELSSEITYADLEQVWLSWYQWWNYHFPKLS